MPRIPRILMPETPTVYHVISRTALPGLPFDASDKDFLQSLILRYSRIYFTEILGFCLMDTPFHLLVRTFPENYGNTASLQERFKLTHGDKALFSSEKISDIRRKWSSLSEFFKDLKQAFSRYYNKKGSSSKRVLPAHLSLYCIRKACSGYHRMSPSGQGGARGGACYRSLPAVV